MPIHGNDDCKVERAWSQEVIDSPFSGTDHHASHGQALMRLLNSGIPLQETHHEMRIAERDDLSSVYLFTLIHRSVDRSTYK